MNNKIYVCKSKLPWHAERVRQWLAGEPISPITVDLALTQKCNLKCQFCYAQCQRQHDSKPWTWEMIENTLNDFAAIGVKAVSFVSDGESTLSSWLIRAIILTKKLGMDAALGTNGVALDRTFSQGIIRELSYLRFNISAARTSRYCEIHGTNQKVFHQVTDNIRAAVALKKELGSDCTIGTQMVFMPRYIDQVIPLTYFAKGLGVDYHMTKHCSDSEDKVLGVDYAAYELCEEVLGRAEKAADERFQVVVKWDKLRQGDKREYSRCLAPPFHLQISGSGRVAPCGFFFEDKHFRNHIGNLHEQRFIDIWRSDRYQQIMDRLKSGNFNPQKACGSLCLQDAGNIYLNAVLEGTVAVSNTPGPAPKHVNFI